MFDHIYNFQPQISLQEDTLNFIWVKDFKPTSNNNSASMFIVSVIVVKALDNNQWPLDWFITHVNTTWFEQEMIALVRTHI